jgi:hypothetical protein
MAEDFVTEDALENPFSEDELYGVATEEPESVESQAPAISQEELQQLRTQAQVLQRFNTDPDFAKRVLLDRAAQLGIPLPGMQGQQQQGPPADYIESVRSTLSPELQFMAPQIANATWTATQAQIAPIQQVQQQQLAQQREQSYQAMAQQLEQEAPGWTQYEDEMVNLLGFIQQAAQGKGSMEHPKYGSMLKLLYRMASGDAQASSTAARRMQTALRAGTRTSSGATRSNGPSLETMINQAKSPQQKWQLAYQHALREQGITG